MKTRTMLMAICVALAAAIMIQGCGSGEPESKPVTVDDLKPIIDAAYKSYLKESREKAINLIVDRAKELAENEIKRLNEAEKVYNEDKVQTVILPGPLAYGWYVKQYRVYYNAEPADIVEDDSLVVAANIYVKYEYRLHETKRYHNTFDEDPFVNAKLETEFSPTDRTGSIVLSYGFDNDYKYNGLPPKVIYKDDATNEVGSGIQAIGEAVEYGAHFVSWSAVQHMQNR